MPAEYIRYAVSKGGEKMEKMEEGRKGGGEEGDEVGRKG